MNNQTLQPSPAVVKVRVSRTDNSGRHHRIDYRIDGMLMKQSWEDVHELSVKPGIHKFSCSIKYEGEGSDGGLHSVTARTSVTLLGRSQEQEISIAEGGLYEWNVFVADSNLKRFAESPGIILGRLFVNAIGIKTFDPDNYDSWPVAISFSVFRLNSDG